ncbi:MAG: transcriptional repressor LexA [Candidatus Neomarinimicrobiota bacterium]
MLTVRQKQVLDFIRERLQQGQISPSYREIRAALGLKSLSTVTHHVRALMRAGYLVNVKGYHGKRALQVAPVSDTPAVEIPLAGVIAAGRPIEALETDETIAVPPTLAEPDNYALKVRGDSMIGDGVLDGDVVVVRRVDTARHREMVVALINGEATLKRLIREKGRTRLKPANPDYPIIDIAPEDDFRIQGVAIGVIRRY